MLPEGFVFLDEAVPGSLSDAKYAGCDNFVGAPVDGYRVPRVAGSKALAEALAVVAEKARAMGYRLLFWDAYRPQRAVDHFIRWSNAPEDGKTKAAHYPNIDRTQLIPLGYVAAKSGHSRGGTIDLMDERSHHGSPLVSAAQTANRETLRALMTGSGFTDYENEWWHYRLAHEPYPETYFDFPIE